MSVKIEIEFSLGNQRVGEINWEIKERKRNKPSLYRKIIGNCADHY